MTKKQKERKKFEHDNFIRMMRLFNQHPARYKTYQDAFAKRNVIFEGEKDYDLAEFEEKYLDFATGSRRDT